MWRRLIYHPEVNYALRQTLILCIPVIIGIFLGNIHLSLLLTLIPACCNIASLDMPHQHFAKRLILGGASFAGISILSQQLIIWQIPLPLIMLTITLILGINGAISPLQARMMPATLVAAIFTLGMAGSFPIWYTPLLFIAGTIWYGLFTWFWFRLWKEQPMRENLSQLFHQLADYIEAKYTMLTQHTDPETMLPPLLQRQQIVMDAINQLYQQLNILPKSRNSEHKWLIRIFQVALDLQEHITVSLHQPEEVQKLVEQSRAETVIRHNTEIIAKRLRIIADNILYHRYEIKRFSMRTELAELEKIATLHPDNPVGHFCYYHFQRIARLLRNQRPLYRRDLMPQYHDLPFKHALVSYLSYKSVALRNAARLAVTLAIGTSLGILFHLPKSYWILLTIMLVTQNGYNATRTRIQHRALGTVLGLMVAAGLLWLQLPEKMTLSIMLIVTFISYIVLRKNYGLAVIGLTITAVCTLQLLALNGAHFLIPRLIDTLLGCVLAFTSTIWLWPQWQSGMLRKYAHQMLETVQHALKLLLQHNSDTSTLAYERMRVNQAHNTAFNAFNQAMQEPGFNSGYLADMNLWFTHSQFIVEHINAMTILVRDHYMLTEKLAAEYLQLCEIAVQSCQQRLEHSGTSISTEHSILQSPELHPDMPVTEMERHIRRILYHLSVMHTISSLAWRQRPNNSNWLSRKLGDY